jgi:DNA-binding NarL/FixJ family response regulator
LPGKQIKVLIVNGRPASAAILRRLLTDDRLIRVVGIASSAAEARALCARKRPDVVLIDIDDGGIEGLETMRRLRQLQPKLRMVATSASREADFIAPAVDAGASGYVPKADLGAVLLSTIQRVATGALVFSEMGAADGRDRSTAAGKSAGAKVVPARLSTRERQVLQLIARGRSTREAAEDLGISIHTIRGHIKRILLKLGVHSRLEAVALALRHDLMKMGE